MFYWWGCLILITLVHKTLAVTTYGDVTITGIHTKEGSYITEKIEKAGFLGGKCKYVLLGRGVQDTLEDNCASKISDYSVINSKKYYALIYPNNYPFSLYTDTYGTLVIVKAGECNVKNYRKNVLKLSSSATKLDKGVCDKIKSKLTDQLNKLEVYWRKWEINHERKMDKLPPAETIFNPIQNQMSTPSLYDGAKTSSGSKGPNKSYFTSAHFKSDSHGQCMITIVVEGRGVVDSITTPCFTINDAQMITFKEGIVIGNPEKDIFSLISDRWGVLVVVNNGKCTKKTFSEEQGTLSTTVLDLSDDECAALKKKMVKEHKSFRNYWRTRVANIKEKLRNLFSFKLW